VDAWTLRIVIAVLGALLLAVIYFTGRPTGAQGRRVASKKADRVEPQMGSGTGPSDGGPGDGLDPELRAELDRLSREMASDREEGVAENTRFSGNETPIDRRTPTEPMAPLRSPVGLRQQDRIDRIITLYVMANEGHTFNGADVVVAAEKTGLEFGDMSVFHRLVESRVDKGPVFSMANLLKPGSFDMQNVQSIQTPGVTLFMTLPGPLSALDAWDAMLPTAQRLAELLNGVVLDEERNTIGRQRIQFMRDELRAYDRAQEKNTIRKPW
jgi:cell division protein ZipA